MMKSNRYQRPRKEVQSMTKTTYREAMNAYHRKWRRENPDKVRAITMRYWMKKAAEMDAAQEAKKDGQQER